MADLNGLASGPVARLALLTLAIVIASCLVSLMVVFMQGNPSGTDLGDLLLAQAAIIPIASAIFIACVAGFVRQRGWRRGLRLLWLSTPPWLVFIGVVLLSLVGIGELSFVLINTASTHEVTLREHVPLLCLLSCIAAFTALFAAANPFDETRDRPIGRWPRAER